MKGLSGHRVSGISVDRRVSSHLVKSHGIQRIPVLMFRDKRDVVDLLGFFFCGTLRHSATD